MTEWHAISKQETETLLKTDLEKGLAFAEAKHRLQKYGKNEIRQLLKIRPFFIFLEQFKSVFIVILFLAALFSLYIKHYVDFSVIIAIILINSAIGFVQQYKAERTISEMKQLLVPNVKVFREGKLIEIPSNELVIGDLIQVNEGDKIMADCRIIHVPGNLETNEAVLTGESFPQKKSAEILSADTELPNRENMLYMGTSIAAGSGNAIVVLTGMNTEFGKIAGMVQAIKTEKTPLEKKLDNFSKKVALVVIVLAAISLLVGFLRGEDLYQMTLTAIALAISVIPEGVPAVIAITLAIAIGRMKKSNALIRKLPAAETLGRTTVICVDKTGTLTEEEMTVSKIYCSRDFYSIRNNNFYAENKKINAEKIPALNQVLKIGVMCNNARVERGKSRNILNIIGDPTEKAFVISAKHAGIFKKEETEKEIRLIEYSFSSKRKLMSIVRENIGNKKITSYVKGAPDILIQKCSKELVDGRVIDRKSVV